MHSYCQLDDVDRSEIKDKLMFCQQTKDDLVKMYQVAVLGLWLVRAQTITRHIICVSAHRLMCQQ